MSIYVFIFYLGQQSNSHDYMDPYHYFIPRQIPVCEPDNDKQPVSIVKVTCGANFTLGFDAIGRVFSWGWHDAGVLGHGRGMGSPSPTMIEPLLNTGKHAIQVACGDKHCLALMSSATSRTADYFNTLLEHKFNADVEIFADGKDTTVFKCHSFMLAARSSYFKGLVRVLKKENPSEEIIRIDLSGYKFANNASIQAILSYIYGDKMHILSHKIEDLIYLAHTLCIYRLRDTMIMRSKDAYNVKLVKYNHWFESNERQGNIDVSSPLQTSYEPQLSTYLHDIEALLTNAKDLFPDLCFIYTCTDANNPISTCIYTHKAIIRQLEYFQRLMSSSFQEIIQQDEADASRHVLKLSIDDIIISGDITIESFHRLLEFAYLGKINFYQSAPTCILTSDSHFEEPLAFDSNRILNYNDTNDLFELTIAANRLGFAKLVSLCERDIISNLRYNFPHNAENCLEFALDFNFPRLEAASLSVLNIMHDYRRESKDDTDNTVCI